MTAMPESFGCEQCWPATADAAWEAQPRRITDVELVDESHFMVKLRSCPQCLQQFVSVFAETIDWDQGRDPQLWCVLPVMPAECAKLRMPGNAILSELRALAPTRRSLCHDSADTSRSYWSCGMVIGPFD